MMKKSYAILRGEITAELTGPQPERFLSACADSDTELWDVRETGPCTLRLCLYERDLERAASIAAHFNCELKTLAARGGRKEAQRLRRRSFALAAALVFALLLCASSLFIWDIEVEGNSRVSDGEILRTLESCGVGVGCFWPGTDAESIRTAFLLREEEIAWMSLNVSGSRAKVVVLERTDRPEIYNRSAAADIVADRDGIIYDMSVENGRALVARGDTVCRGDTLISGSFGAFDVRASGRVEADTWYEKLIYTAPGASKKEDEKGAGLCVALKAGRDRINIFKISSKTTDGYDKITKEYPIGIKGLFRFPISVVTESFYSYSSSGAPEAESGVFERRTLNSLIESTDGRVLSCEFTQGDGFIVMRAHCAENIAAQKEYTDGDDR